MAGDSSILPLDILAAIAMKLETVEDFNNFSAVCRWWSCAPPLIKNQWKPVMPWLLLAENTADNPDCVRKIFSLGSTKKCFKLKLPEMVGVRCWGSPYGWVGMIDIDLNILLFNPITKARLCFPPWNTLPNSPKRNSKRISSTTDEEDSYCCFLQCCVMKLFVLKVHHEFVIAMLYYGGCELALARHEDLSWMSVPAHPGTIVTVLDIISIDDNMYALYDDGSIRYWNLKEIGSEHLAKPIAYIPGRGTSFHAPDEVRVGIRTMYLVQSGSDILVLFRYKEVVYRNLGGYNGYPFYQYDFNTLYRTVKFRVLRAVRKDKRWEQVDDLGDVALFVGNNNSMSLSTTHAKYLRRNCIYFTDDENMLWTAPKEFGGHDMGVYDLESAQISPLYEGDSIRSSYCPPMFFITQRP